MTRFPISSKTYHGLNIEAVEFGTSESSRPCVAVIFGLIGPTLNLSIWKGVDASVVYLNGLLLFIAGFSIVRTYNYRAFDWNLMITLIVWLCLLIGAYRLFFPNSPQLRNNDITYAVLLLLFSIGSILRYKGYVD